MMTTNDPEPIERKLDSLKDFLHLGRDVIIKHLQENEYDVDRTLLKLVALESQKQPPANIESIIRELLNSGFSDLGREFIMETLKKNNWDTEKVLIPLVEAKNDLERKIEKEKKLKEEQIRKLKIEQEAKIKEEQLRKLREEEQLRKLREEERLRKLKEEEQVRKLREEEMKRLKNEEQLRKLREDEQLRKIKEAEEERIEQIRKFREEEQLRKLKEEEQLRKIREEEQLRKIREEEQIRKIREEETRKLREEETRKLQVETKREITRKIQEEEHRKKLEEEKHRKKLEEEEHQKKLEEEEHRKKLEEEKQKLEHLRKIREARNTEIPARAPEQHFPKFEENQKPLFPDTFSPPKPFSPLDASTTEFVHLDTSPKSNDITIKLTVKPDHVEAGDNITVIWEHSDRPTSTDWIGFYSNSSNQDKEYISYHWVSPDTAAGSFSIKTPSKPGSYVFKYFVNRTYVCLASSNVFRVGPAYRLTATPLGTLEVKITVDQFFGAASSSAWIGMYEPEKDNKSYQQYHYLSGKKEFTFIAPKSGRWDFRVFPSKAYDYTDSISVNL